MKLDWDDPFQTGMVVNFDDKKFVQMKKEDHTGIYAPVPDPTLDEIRERQHGLFPFFNAIYESAETVRESLSSDDKNACKVDLLYNIAFRLPDEPKMVGEYMHMVTAHVVPLPASGHASHPIVDSIFPVVPHSRLNPNARAALRGSILRPPSEDEVEGVKNGDLEKRPPPEQYTRIVPVEMARLLKNWIIDIVSPINDLKFDAKPVRKNRMRAVFQQTLNYSGYRRIADVKLDAFLTLPFVNAQVSGQMQAFLRQ
ncbi:MAG: hypothetical protein KGI97_06835 [Alphaproteobacteria bacterium]|nr:hypothetical protein [Alphaproteobacteria bacterium]